jgi:acyl dehydratase
MTSLARNPQGVPIGEQLGFLEYLVINDNLLSVRRTVEYNDLQFTNFVSREHLIVLLQKYNLGELESVTHADYYLRPPVTGRRVQVTGWIRERPRESGAELLVVETFAVDEIGTEILRSRHVFRQGSGRTPARLGRRPARSRSAAALEFLAPVHKRVTEETIEDFEAAHRALVGAAAASGGANQGSGHTGAGLARGMGLAASVAPEELSMAYLHEMLDRRFGIDFRQGGRLTVNYRRPIYAGDSLSVQGMVAGTEQDGERTVWRLQVWVENGRGESVVTGDAQVTVPSPLT